MGKAEKSSSLTEPLGTRLQQIQALLEDVDEEAARRLLRMILRAERVFVTGKGRSGLVAQCFAMRLMQMGFETHVPGEATCPRIEQNDLMVAVSCSGTTMTTVQMARIAHRSGAQVVAVTADPDSPLAATADHTILVPVTGEDLREGYRDVLGPYNNTLFEEAVLLYFDSMVYWALGREGIPERTLTQRHTNLE
ncbi:MAG: SIS domain-containing protein [Candidatus Brocadiaceae bacterium]|jgi:6-phospho-3-hexuloisomerase